MGNLTEIVAVDTLAILASQVSGTLGQHPFCHSGSDTGLTAQATSNTHTQVCGCVL